MRSAVAPPGQVSNKPKQTQPQSIIGARVRLLLFDKPSSNLDAPPLQRAMPSASHRN